MGADNEDVVSQCLEKLPERSPDYAAMWLRIQEEAAGRKSGWIKGKSGNGEGLSEVQPKRTKAQRVLLVSAAAICLVFIPALILFTVENRAGQPVHPSDQVGQTINKKTDLNGVTLTLDNVAAVPEFAGGESLMRLFVSLELDGGSKYDQVEFAEERLTDRSTRETKELPGGGFKQDEQGGTLSKMYDINGIEVPKTAGSYRLSVKDLRLSKQKDIVLKGALQEESGASPTFEESGITTVHPVKRAFGQSDIITVRSVKRKDNKLTVQYTLAMKAKAQQTSKGLLFKVGNTEILAGNRSVDKQGLYTDIINLNGFSEAQIQRGELHYSYMDTIRTVAGEWAIDFSVDFTQAVQPSSLHALTPDQKLRSLSGISLRELSLSPLQVGVSYGREQALDIEDPQGKVFWYNDVKLKAGDKMIAGQQIEQVEGNGGDFWFLSQNTDWSGRDLTLYLSGPVRVERNLSLNWSGLPNPAKEKQRLALKLSNGYEIEYTYFQEGDDLYIQTKAPQPIRIMYGTVLKVNGQLVHPDPGDSWFSADYNRRTDHYTGIPAKAGIEINPGSYGVLDPSGDVTIRIK